MLFHCDTSGVLALDTPAHVATPLGTVQYDALINGTAIQDMQPSSVLLTPSGGRLYCWTEDLYRAELLLSPYNAVSPDDKKPQGCWAGIWRMKAICDVDSLQFTCLWEDGYTWTDSGPDSDEWLDAQTWDDEQADVTIGTEDCDALSARAKRGDWLPSRWEQMLECGAPYTTDVLKGKYHPVEYEKKGFRMMLPSLQATELCQIHFAVAWSPAQSSNVALSVEETYQLAVFAVDKSPAEILAALGCI